MTVRTIGRITQLAGILITGLICVSGCNDSRHSKQLPRFDGIYMTHEHGSSFQHYIRFYEDKTVLAINATTGTAEEIGEWFRKENIISRDLPNGTFTNINDRIIFTIVLRDSTTKKGMPTNYQCQLDGSRLKVDIIDLDAGVAYGETLFYFSEIQ